MKDELTPESLSKQQKSTEPEEQVEEEVTISEEEAARAMEVFRQEQNIVMGAIYGFIAALVGAGVWAGVTIATGYQIGWIAVGVGFLVGIAVRAGGKGLDATYGVVGAVMALIGCALGNLFTIAWFVSGEFDTSVVDIMNQLNVEMVVELMKATFTPMDLLFYGLALYFGFRYSIRELTMDDFNRALGRAM